MVRDAPFHTPTDTFPTIVRSSTMRREDASEWGFAIGYKSSQYPNGRFLKMNEWMSKTNVRNLERQV